MRVLPSLLLVFALVLPSAAHGFDAQRTPQGRVVHAPRTPWPVFLQADGFDGLTVAKIQNVVRNVIAAWNAVPGTRIQLSYGGLVRQAPHLGVYIWHNDNFQWQGGDAPAQTDVEWDDDGGLTQATIALNGQDFRWVTSKQPATGDQRTDADLQAVLTHQLGHALGLAHSHDAQATMYFWLTTSTGRTLANDDVRALQFVYPAAENTASVTCDPCRSDADCAGGGRCLAWPDGYAYCAEPCATSDDCPTGTSCGSYQGGIACLPNDGHCGADLAVDRFGDPCAADVACVDSGFCMTVTNGQAFCTTGCNSGCKNGSVCNSANLCVERGKRPDGEVCRVPGDCISSVCMASSWRAGTCGRTCSFGCAIGELCGQDGQCRVECSKGCPAGMACGSDGTCRGPMGPGWPCGSTYDCTSGECVTLSGLQFAAICTQSCEVPSDCPPGTGCSSTTKGMLCIPGKSLTAGSPCTTSAMCGKGNGCDLSKIFGGFGKCVPTCAPFGLSGDCTAISGTGVCAWNGDSGLCVSDTSGKKEGTSCDAQSPCRADLVCAQIGSSSACRIDCDLNNPVCAEGLSCLALDGSSVRGVCADGGAEAKSVVPALQKVLNPDARDVSLPSVVPISQWQPPPIATATPGVKSSCSSSREGDGNSFFFLLVGGCLYWGYRRWGQPPGGRKFSHPPTASR